MSNLKKIALAILVAAFCASTPVIAAETAAPAKPDIAAGLKQKAATAIEQGQKKMDTAAQNLQKSLGLQSPSQNATMPNQNATTGAGEMVDVQQESVTVETPNGTATETTTVITPETPAAPAKK